MIKVYITDGYRGESVLIRVSERGTSPRAAAHVASRHIGGDAGSRSNGMTRRIGGGGWFGFGSPPPFFSPPAGAKNQAPKGAANQTPTSKNPPTEAANTKNPT